MRAISQQFEVPTLGNNHVIDLTAQVAAIASAARVNDGLVTVFVVGSTAGVTTTEFEPGLVSHDLAAAFEKIAPEHARYVHEQTWNDDNGHSHIRASLLGPSLTLPLINGKLPLGTWQQIVLIDFDTRPRTRTIIVQVLGEIEN
jgi:secondary thiamine-phosphate synthase enzyme